jgi:C-terminal processing protease CtpA/Prc
MFVGSFEGDFDQTQVDVDAAVNQFRASGVKNLLIDVTNNGGLYEFMTKCQKL